VAGVSSKEIKNRIRSMESTKQITKAMEMVAASKLRKTQRDVQASRPYFQILAETVENIAAAEESFTSPYLTRRPEGKTAWVVFAGDRGLAGGYNSNILKMAFAAMDEDAVVVPIGRKALEFFKNRGVSVLTESYGLCEELKVGDCFTVAKLLCKEYLAGTFRQVFFAYTDFCSVLQQTPVTRQLLPLQKPETTAPVNTEIVYEPDPQTVFSAIVPEYVGGMLYGALCESRASEQAARRSAMDAATQNADTMIEDLSLELNRARQAAITREITEIVAGV
jgi:F-type H+-transporting ATPase subunit gamma